MLLKPRTNGRNTVGQQLLTLLDVTCCIRLHSNVGSVCTALPTMLEELCKRIQHCCATFRRSRNKRNVGSCWLKSLTGFKLCATTSTNMQQGVQTATCNIQQCLELLVNNVASVCTQPKMACYSFQKIKITILKKIFISNLQATGDFC